MSVVTSEKPGALLFFIFLRARWISSREGMVPSSEETVCCLISSRTIGSILAVLLNTVL